MSAYIRTGCGSFVARLHYVYVVYDVKRPAQICDRISWRRMPRVAWVVILRIRGFHQRRFFRGKREGRGGGERGFYCLWTRASCWNSKGSFRRDITPNVRVDPPGSIKGGERSDDGGGLMISFCTCKRYY